MGSNNRPYFEGFRIKFINFTCSGIKKVKLFKVGPNQIQVDNRSKALGINSVGKVVIVKRGFKVRQITISNFLIKILYLIIIGVYLPIL